MKKSIILLLIYILKSSTTYSQTPDCKCEKDPTYYTVTIPLCGGYQGYQDNSIEPFSNPNALIIDFVYTKTICNGITTIDIYSMGMHSPLWNYHNAGYTINELLPCDDMCPADADGWPLDLDATSQPLYDDWFKRMIAKYAPFPISTNENEVLIKSACKSMVMVEWPKDATYTIMPGDGGGAPTTVAMTNSLMWANCQNAVCCLMKVVQVKDHMSFQFSSLIPPNQECGEIDPDFKPTCGGYTGTIIDQTPCKPMCESNILVYFTTDVTEVGKKINLEFTASPTLFNDYIKIESSLLVKKIEIYDIQGKKVIDNSSGSQELNTSNLKSGTFYMRVYLENNQIQTVKLFKK